MAIDMEKMSLGELKKLQRDVTKAIETFEDRQRSEARAAIEAKAREMGFTVSDLFDASRKGKTKRPAKYRHPENSDLTWSGRGRQPRWIKEALTSGKALEEFLIIP